MTFLTPAIMIVLLASVYLFIVISINHKWGVRKKMKKINKQMKQLQHEMKDAEKRMDKVKLSEIQGQQMELMSKMSKMMFKSMVPMIIILPLAFLLFAHVSSEYMLYSFNLPFSVPFLHESNVYNSTEFMIVILFVMGFVGNTIFYKIIEKFDNEI